MTLTFKRVTRNPMCVFLLCCSTKPNIFFLKHNQKYGTSIAHLIKGYSFLSKIMEEHNQRWNENDNMFTFLHFVQLMHGTSAL